MHCMNRPFIQCSTLHIRYSWTLELIIEMFIFWEKSLNLRKFGKILLEVHKSRGGLFSVHAAFNPSHRIFLNIWTHHRNVHIMKETTEQWKIYWNHAGGLLKQKRAVHTEFNPSHLIFLNIGAYKRNFHILWKK